MPHPKLSFVTLVFSLGLSAHGRAETPVDPGTQPTVYISDVRLVEGDTGTTTFAALAGVFGGSFSTLTVKVSATPGTADESDYVFAPVELTFTSPSDSFLVTGQIVGDTAPEGDETFTLTATLVSPTLPYFYSSGGLVTIMDDDQEHASRLHAEGATLLEGNQGTTTVEARVVLEPASINTVTVDYRTADGTALASQDYQAVSGTLTFAPGEVEKTVPVAIVADRLVEGDEVFSLVLSNPNQALMGTPQAMIAIVNDDRPIHATIDDLEADEGDTSATSVPVTIHFDGPADAAQKVSVSLVGVTATVREDFMDDTYLLSPPSGATEMTFTVRVWGDTQPECDEGLLIVYSTLNMGDNTTKTAKLLIRNDDGPAQGCGDPFTRPPVEAAVDGGAPRVDASAVDAPTVDVPTVDAAVAAPAGDAISPDLAAAAEAGSIGVVDGPVPPADAWVPPISDGGPSGGAADGATAPERPKSSGCFCTLGRRAPEPWLLLLGVASGLALLHRRRREPPV